MICGHMMKIARRPCARSVGHLGQHQTRSELDRRAAKRYLHRGKREVPMLATVRMREGVWEYRCPDCPHGTRWWPLTEEFWNPRNMARCRACTLEQRRKRDRARPRDIAYMKAYREVARDAIALYNRDYYERNRDAVLAQVKEYGDRNREHINARRRERYATDPVFRAKKRAYYHANAEKYREAARRRYQEKVAA